MGSNATDSNLDIGLDTFSTGTTYRVKTGGTSVVDTLTFNAGIHQFLMVMRATGGYLFYRVGTSYIPTGP
jgi:hypothetical protein